MQFSSLPRHTRDGVSSGGITKQILITKKGWVNDGRDEMPCYSLLLLMLGVVDRRVTAAHAHTCPALPAYSAWHAHPYNSANAAASSRITPMLTPFNLQLNSI